jgi:hypothetical protein
MRVSTASLVVPLLILFSSCSGSRSQEALREPQIAPTESMTQAGSEDPKEVAMTALAGLRQLLAAGQDYHAMGFDSPKQISEATLGDPASVSLVRLDQLRDYKSNIDPQSLLVDAHRLVYPVNVSGRGRTLITLEKKAGKWQFVSFGDQDIAENLVKVRQDKSTAPGGEPASDYFLVQVDSLFLTFLGIRSNTNAGSPTLILVPLNGAAELRAGPGFHQHMKFLSANPNFNAENEGTKKAKEVFLILSDAAQKLDESEPF